MTVISSTRAGNNKTRNEGIFQRYKSNQADFEACGILDKQLDALGAQTQALVNLLTDTYAAGSPRLGRGVKPAPCDYSAEVAAPWQRMQNARPHW